MEEKILKSYLRYDKNTGIFMWKKSGSGRKKTLIAGCKDSYGYITIRIKGKNYKAHRLAWLYVYGEFPKWQIDHINRNRGDNRIINLRDVTQLENSKNRKVSINNTSGHIGVSFRTKIKKWKAQIQVNNKYIFLGYFEKKQDALKSREEAEKKYKFLAKNYEKTCS